MQAKREGEKEGKGKGERAVKHSLIGERVV